MTNRLLQRGFAGGEIAPAMLSRTDLEHYKMGAFKLHNFIVLPQGAVRTRSGFKYVGTPINAYKDVRIIPFRYSSTQTFALEFGDYTMRIISNGGYVVDSDGNKLTITTPYASENLKYLDYSQNADIVTITSNLYPPYDLKRYSNTSWSFERVSLNGSITPPASVWCNPVYASSMTSAEESSKNKLTVSYVVTAFDSLNRESLQSSVVSGVGNYYINGAKIRVAWGTVSGATRYRVYRQVSGVFGYIGETESLYLDDEGLNPDTSITPPRYKTIFTDSSNQITSVTIRAVGSGYNFGFINNLYYLPRSLSLTKVPAYHSPEYDTEEEANSWSIVSPKFKVVDGLAIAVKQSFDISLTYQTKQVGEKYIRYAYINGTQTFYFTSSKLAIAGCIFRITSSNDTLVFDTDGYEKLIEGVTIGDYLKLFPQSTTCQMPLTISDAVGVNADIDVVTKNGAVSYVQINSKGYSYSSSTSAILNSSIGSGALFTVNTTGSSLPDYPSACAQYDQRRVFGGSSPHPLKVWLTNSGQQTVMSYHIPTLDDDRIEIEAVTQDADRIKHIVALDSLILFTSTSELRVFTQNSDALTPSSIAVRAQSYVGANEVQPVIVNNIIVYSASRGGHMRALGYDYNAQGYITQDISLRACHLFDDKEIVSFSLSKAPVQVLWCVSSSGALLSCTFLPEQQLVAWSKVTTRNGSFEDVCVISEGKEDCVYAVVNRNGVRRIERLTNLAVSERALDYRYMDCYLDTVFSSKTSIVSGLSHLEGQEVAVFVDGKQQTNKTVSQGLVKLDEAGTNIAIGLPIEYQMVTLPLISAKEAESMGFVKNISEVLLRISYSGNIKTGNYPAGKLYSCKLDDAYMGAQDEESKLVKVSVDGEWSAQGQINIVHDNALPLEIQAIVLNVSFEGGK